MLKFLPLLLFLFSCTIGPGNLHVRHSTDLRARNIKRIAVLPLDPIPLGKPSNIPHFQNPSGGEKEREKKTASTISNHLYSTMVALSRWQIVSDREINEVKSMIPLGSKAEQAKKLGELVFADAVIFGRVYRYRERVGGKLGAKSPASVAFVLDLWDAKEGDLIWTARFDETQKPLSKNIFAFGEFAERGAKWLKAEELAVEGFKKAIHQLHKILYSQPT